MVGRDDGQVGGDSKDVAHRPRLEEVERDVDVGLEQRLERDQALFDFLRRVPVRILVLVLRGGAGGFVGAGVSPALEELFHGVDGLASLVVGDVDDVVEEELGYEAEELWEEDGGHGRRGPRRAGMCARAHDDQERTAERVFGLPQRAAASTGREDNGFDRERLKEHNAATGQGLSTV